MCIRCLELQTATNYFFLLFRIDLCVSIFPADILIIFSEKVKWRPSRCCAFKFEFLLSATMRSSLQPCYRLIKLLVMELARLRCSLQ